MRRLKYPGHIVVAILIATLLCNKGVSMTYAAGVMPQNEQETTVSADSVERTGSTQKDDYAQGDYADGEVLLLLEDGGLQTLRAEGVTQEAEGNDMGMQFVVVGLSDDMDVEEAVAYYSDLPGIAYAQPNYIYEPEEPDISVETTSDPYYSSQWYLDYLNMTDTWKYMNRVPRSRVRVAIIDTGIDLSHPDLAANVNPQYCVSSVTDDYYQITDDVSTAGHGTHIAGIVGAVTDNARGVAGLSDSYTEIAAIQCSDGAAIYSSYVVRAIQYAIRIDADVINMSLGMNTHDPLLEAALQEAYDAGILVVCSAGNDGTDRKHYPSAYSSTIGIIAAKEDGTKRSDASYGTDNFISAPGDSIMSTLPGGTYGYRSGSSMAAGVVTGIAADMLSVNPNLSVEEIRTILAQTATDTYTTGFDAYSGWGMIAADKAVAKAAGIDVTTNPDTPPRSAKEFVQRLYQICLNREGEAAGILDWVNRLTSQRENGGEVAAGFLFSDEFKNRNLDDESYIDILYRVFLGREADAAGKAYWQEKLQNGMSRLYVMNGFSASAEFTEICRACGFEPGTVPSDQMRDVNEGVTAFVARMYEKALGREYDINGLNDWCGRILRRDFTPYRVATEGFFHSQEFANRRTSNQEFVKILYRTFLDREYEEDGYRYWVSRLNAGESRDSVIAGFSNSREFANLMAKYGL